MYNSQRDALEKLMAGGEEAEAPVEDGEETEEMDNRKVVVKEEKKDKIQKKEEESEKKQDGDSEKENDDTKADDQAANGLASEDKTKENNKDLGKIFNVILPVNLLNRDIYISRIVSPFVYIQGVSKKNYPLLETQNFRHFVFRN